MTTPIPPLALSPRDAARACGVSISTLMRAERDGLIRGARIGRRVVFLTKDIMDALEAARDRGDLNGDLERPEHAETVADLAAVDPEIEARLNELMAEIEAGSEALQETWAELCPDRARTLAIVQARTRKGAK